MDRLFDNRGNILDVGTGGGGDTAPSVTTSEEMRKLTTDKANPSYTDVVSLGGMRFRRDPNRLNEWRAEDSKEIVSPFVKVAEKSRLGLFIGIDLKGRFCFMNSPLTAIVYLDNFEDSTLKTLYDLRSMDSSFNTIRNAWFLDDGNVLVYESGNTSTDYCGGLWLIDTVNETFTKTCTFGTPNVIFLHRQGFVSNGKNLYYGEYGTWGQVGRLWGSRDFGKTWQLLKNFTNEEGVVPEGLHIHGLTYDHFWHRLWVATGDYAYTDGRSCKRIWWSDDEGVTWNNKDLAKYYGPSVSATQSCQLLTGFADEKFLLFGGDDYQNCIYRTIRKPNDVILDRVFKYAPEVTGKVTQYTGEWKKLSNGIIVAPVLNGDSGNFPQQTRLMGTFDGVNWTVLYSEEPLTSGSLPVANDGTLVEHEGYVYYGSVTANEASKQITKLIKFRLPTVY